MFVPGLQWKAGPDEGVGDVHADGATYAVFPGGCTG